MEVERDGTEREGYGGKGPNEREEDKRETERNGENRRENGGAKRDEGMEEQRKLPFLPTTYFPFLAC